MIVIHESEDDTRQCVGTDLQSLAKVGLLGWRQGYTLARADAPRFRSESECQQAAEASCHQCFTRYAPLDVSTLQHAYFLGWHMGYAAMVRGDVWMPHDSPAVDVAEGASLLETDIDVHH